MGTRTIAVLVTIAFSVIGVLGDYFLKLASAREQPLRAGWFYVGFVLYASTAFGWVFVMQHLKLGTISEEVESMQQALARYGYAVPISGKYDGATMEVVTAFQRHFRPARVDGVADQSTLTTLQALLATMPADAKVAAG